MEGTRYSTAPGAIADALRASCRICDDVEDQFTNFFDQQGEEEASLCIDLATLARCSP